MTQPKPPRAAPLYAYPGFAHGYDNVSRADRLPKDALTEAFNVDITNAASVRRREGFTKIFDGQAHSVWSCALGVYFVGNGTLYRRTNDANEVIAHGLRNDPISYELINGDVYWANGYQKGVLRGGIAPALWGIQIPSGGFTLAQTGGALTQGTYQVRITYVRSSGEESGASDVSTITAAGGITITGLSASADPEVISLNVYMTRPDGTEFLKVGEVINGASGTVISAPSYTESLKSLFKKPPPNSSIIRLFKARAVAVDYDTLYFSDPFSYSWFDMRANFIRMAGEITMCAALDNGIYVSDSTGTHWLQGSDPANLAKTTLTSRKAVKGTAIVVNPSDAGGAGNPYVLFTTDSGIVSGDSNGAITDVTSAKVVIPKGESGAAMLRQVDGSTQYVTSISADDGTTSRFKAVDNFEIELISRGGVPV